MLIREETDEHDMACAWYLLLEQQGYPVWEEIKEKLLTNAKTANINQPMQILDNAVNNFRKKQAETRFGKDILDMFWTKNIKTSPLRYNTEDKILERAKNFGQKWSMYIMLYGTSLTYNWQKPTDYQITNRHVLDDSS